MLPALLVLIALFALLFVTRVGGARRAELLARWPALLFAGAALVALLRGMVWPGVALSAIGALIWVLWPSITRERSAPGGVRPDDSADQDARRVLGVGADASESDIRNAYRAKMASAHPDRGGAHNEAARLTAARDRLLKKKRER